MSTKGNFSGLDEPVLEEGLQAPEAGGGKEEKPKRKPFHYWDVGGKQYRLKLTAERQCAIEQKLGKNLYVLFENMPYLSEMLTIIQGAMSPWHHGTTYATVQKLYDTYIEEGGSQTEFFQDVVIPTMVVSGFFPEAESVKLMQELGS
jgi:hypothetical protein